MHPAPSSRSSAALLPALALAGLAALALPARAQNVVETIQGKVQQVNASGTVLDALTAHGVVVGADVTVTATIDPTVAGHPLNGFTEYNAGITDMSVTVGTWKAQMTVPPLVPDINFVQVGNDIPSGQFKNDSYTLSSVGTDTDLILTGNSPFATCEMLCLFVDANGKTIANDGVVQDPNKFPFGSGGVSGPDGNSIGIQFKTTGGGGGGGGNKGPGLCRKGQLLAAGKFGKALLLAHAKSASGKPGSDPFDAKLNQAIDTAETKFAAAFKKAIDKALKAGGSAPLGESQQGAAKSAIEDPIGPLVDGVTAGEDQNSPFDRALRGSLLKAAATLCSADLSAYAGNAMKPSAGKLKTKLGAALDALTKKVNKAIDAAAKHGVTYTGPSATDIGSSLGDLASAFDLLTQGTAPTAAATALDNAKAVSSAVLAHSR